MKFFWVEDACSLVLIESIGKRTRSMLVPAIPPDNEAVMKVLSVNVCAQIDGLF